VQAEKTGFERYVTKGLVLQVAQEARLDIQLQLGGLEQTIEVSAAAPLLQTEGSTVGQVIDTKPIETLPLNGRNIVQLAMVAPGVTGLAVKRSRRATTPQSYNLYRPLLLAAEDSVCRPIFVARLQLLEVRWSRLAPNLSRASEGAVREYSRVRKAGSRKRLEANGKAMMTPTESGWLPAMHSAGIWKIA
jgi:hypothetical protein